MSNEGCTVSFAIKRLLNKEELTKTIKIIMSMRSKPNPKEDQF